MCMMSFCIEMCMCNMCASNGSVKWKHHFMLLAIISYRVGTVHILV